MLFKKIKEKAKKQPAIRNWGQLLEFYENEIKKKYDTEWIFRGLSTDYIPSPALEREIKNFTLKQKDAFDIEFGLLDKFKRNLHLYEPSLPHDLTIVEYLAMMRHWGAPTRLLDFTYSFYVAVFFALEKVDKKQKKHAVVWIIDSIWLEKQARESHLKLEKKDFMPGKNDDHFKKYFYSENVKPLIYQVTPGLLNSRLAIQQGTFLCPSNIKYSFEKNFQNILPHMQNVYDKIKLIMIHPSARDEFLRELFRMNITRATLFPGLTGFTESLKTMMLFKTSMQAYSNKRKALS